MVGCIVVSSGGPLAGVVPRMRLRTGRAKPCELVHNGMLLSNAGMAVIGPCRVFGHFCAPSGMRQPGCGPLVGACAGYGLVRVPSAASRRRTAAGVRVAWGVEVGRRGAAWR